MGKLRLDCDEPVVEGVEVTIGEFGIKFEGKRKGKNKRTLFQRRQGNIYIWLQYRAWYMSHRGHDDHT